LQPRPTPNSRTPEAPPNATSWWPTAGSLHPRTQMSLTSRSSSSVTRHREAPPPSTPRYMGVDYYSASTTLTTKTSRRPTESSPYDATSTRTQPTRRQKPSSRISLVHMRLPAPPSHSLCLAMIIMFDLATLGCRSILCPYPCGS
jgi:hypothetical protein